MTGPAKPRPKFNRRCAWLEDCNSWTASIFCKPHYMSLPTHIRHALWSSDPHVIRQAIKDAVQFLDDKRDNALIVKEEGP
jgi:hypothetical protein